MLGDSHPRTSNTHVERRFLFFPVQSLIRGAVWRCHPWCAVPSLGLHRPIQDQPRLGGSAESSDSNDAEPRTTELSAMMRVPQAIIDSLFSKRMAACIDAAVP